MADIQAGVPTPNLYQRILAVMGELDYVQKEAKKPGGMQYTFVSHDAVTAKIHPLLVKHGIAMLPSVVEFTQDGNRVAATVNVTFINVDMPEDRHTVQFFGYGIDTQDKGPGKAVSYAVKYAMLKTFCLETGDDPEKDDIEHKPAEKAAPPRTSRPASKPAAEQPATNGDAHTFDQRFEAAKQAVLTAESEEQLAKTEKRIALSGFSEDQTMILNNFIARRRESLAAEPVNA